MRKLFLLPLAALFVLYACKREGSSETEKVKPEDPKALSSAIKVWHGVRTQGNLPASTSNPNGPVLDIQSNNQSIRAISGRYAIIQPEVVSGNLAGYYIKVNGASDYFKVDYSKPREMNRSMSPVRKSRHNKALSRGLGIDSTGNGTLDSALVIVIPSTIQPGQFCVTYCAYDSLGNISNPITACITISAFGGDATSTYLHGTWHMTGMAYDDTTMGWEPIYGYADTFLSTGYCVNGHIVDTFGTGPGFIEYPMYISTTSQADLSFGSNGGLNYTYGYNEKEFDYVNSTCSSWAFHTYTESDALNGAWSFNSTTNKMILVFDFDDLYYPDPEFYEYQLIKLSNNRILLYDPEYEEWLRLEK